MAMRLFQQKTSSLLSVLLLLTFISCGSDSGSGKGASIDNYELPYDTSGVYRAVLSPLNSSLAGEVRGTVTIRLRGDRFIAESAISGAPVGIRHFQDLIIGSACPDESADQNSDGIIDAVEGSGVYGKILVPLDSNLSSQIEGSNFGPIANPAGAIVYKRSTSVTDLLADLRDEDPNPYDELVKLLPHQKMILKDKAVVIRGVSQELPGSAQGIGENTAAASLPIACGILRRIDNEEEPTNLPELID